MHGTTPRVVDWKNQKKTITFKRMNTYFISLSLILIIFVGCSTPMHKRIEQVKAGMEKTEVLELLGSPKSAEFKFGKHEWHYVYYIDDIKYEKVIWIENKVVSKIEDINKTKTTTPIDSEGDLKTDEISGIKKALEQNKKIKKYEEGFEDLN
jgi:outer membrane protein assembly factor BamE (lipoprotein component of BamABCDE complex)